MNSTRASGSPPMTSSEEYLGMRNANFSLLSIIVAAAVAGAAAIAMPAIAAPAPPAAAPVAPILASRPGAAADGLTAGLTRMAGDAIIYRPLNLGPGPHPLIVLLHGAGQGANELIPVFRPEADKRGLILLAPKSAGDTWDLIVSAARFHGRPPKNGEMPEFGPDVARIDATLATVFQKAAIDPKQSSSPVSRTGPAMRCRWVSPIRTCSTA